MTEPPSATSISAAALAERHGLSRSGARPSLPAYAGQLWGRRHFILTYAQSRVRAQYSASFLGQLWQVLTPLLNAAVYFFVFGLLLNANRGVENYPAFLVAGVFIFTYTQRAVLAGAQSIAGNLGSCARCTSPAQRCRWPRPWSSSSSC
jgi:teichoic acid transport system permease protein